MTDKYGGPERRLKPPNSNGVTWKWVSAALLGVSSVTGAAWLNANSTEISSLKLAQKQQDSDTNNLKTKAGVIEEKVRRIEEDVKDVKENQKEQSKKLDENNRKLDELLRRSR